MAGQEKPPAGPAAEEGAPESSDVLHIVEPEDPMPDAGPGPLLTEGKLGLGLQARVVAQKKAPTVAAQTERRDRKVIVAFLSTYAPAAATRTYAFLSLSPVSVHSQQAEEGSAAQYLCQCAQGAWPLPSSRGK